MTGFRVEDLLPPGICQRTPPIGDRVLLDLVCGLQGQEENLAYRANQSRLSRVLARLMPSPDRQLHFDRLALLTQQSVCQLVSNLSQHQTVTDRALMLTQTLLTRTMESIATTRDRVETQISELDQRLSALARCVEAVESRLGDHELRLVALEAFVQGTHSIDDAFMAWRTGTRYGALAWCYQLVLVNEDVLGDQLWNRLQPEQSKSLWNRAVGSAIDTLQPRIGSRPFSLIESAARCASLMQEGDRRLLAYVTDAGPTAGYATQQTSCPLRNYLSLTIQLSLVMDEQSAARAAYDLVGEKGVELPQILDLEELCDGLFGEGDALRRSMLPPEGWR